VADTFVSDKKVTSGNNAAAKMQRFGVNGLPAHQADPAMQRLATVGPFVVPMG
jgi:hypothetical protein